MGDFTCDSHPSFLTAASNTLFYPHHIDFVQLTICQPLPYPCIYHRCEEKWTAYNYHKWAAYPWSIQAHRELLLWTCNSRSTLVRGLLATQGRSPTIKKYKIFFSLGRMMNNSMNLKNVFIQLQTWFTGKLLARLLGITKIRYSKN